MDYGFDDDRLGSKELVLQEEQRVSEFETLGLVSRK